MALERKSLAVHEESARKRPAKFPVNSHLPARAYELGIDLSGTLEEASVHRPTRQQRRDWIESNHTAVRSYNRRVKAERSYGDRMRRF